MKFQSIIKITFLFLALFFVRNSVFAATTGFSTSEVQFSSSSIIQDKEIEISIGFINYEDKKLTGKINFYNKDILLGSRDLELDSKQSGEYSIVWKASLGEHSFIARAENLKISGSNVTILGPSTEPKDLLVGFKSSSVAEKLRERGGFSSVVAGIIDETKSFFTPIIQSLDEWRDSKINPLIVTKERVDSEKEAIEEGKIKPLLVVHSIVLFILIFIVTYKVVFFGLVILLLIWVLVRFVRLFKRIIRKDYSE